ncbi:MAG: prepilin-type N-terminal cleavage/methylation domain-containing protein [Deltaproteobacteria bacterium]|nr:MAG: prepilin-type N-terminal cleavage/methylation domain-containing protein [Deltaproteobacteria bacterium]
MLISKSKESNRPGLTGNRSGLTLIELVITISILALVVTIMVPAVGTLGGVGLRTSASRLAGTISFAYDLAARKNSVVRLVFDLDQNSYWLEIAGGKFTLNREKDEVSQGRVDEEAHARGSRLFVDREEIESGSIWQPRPRTTFARYSEGGMDKVELGDEVHFQDVWVAHQTERVTAGKAYLYFFPTGMTEKAYVHLADDDQQAYTLVVESLLGTVKVYPSYIEEPLE